MIGASRWSTIRSVTSLFIDVDRDRDRVRSFAARTHCQTGIGTYTSPQLVTSAGQAISKTLDQMVAWNLDMHVMGASLHSTCPVLP